MAGSGSWATRPRIGLPSRPPILTQLPLDAGLNEYRLAASRLEEALKSVPGLIAVYALGSVGAPGISDIDRIAVLESPASFEQSWRSLPDRTRALCQHTPFAVDQETFAAHRWIADLDRLELVSGRGIALAADVRPPAVERSLALEGLLAALLNMRKQLWMGRIKVRSSLCQLHSLHHSVRLGDIESPKLSAVIAHADRLRQLWNDLADATRADELRDLIAAAPGGINEAIVLLGDLRAMSDDSGIPLRAPWKSVRLIPAGLSPPRSSGPMRIVRGSRRASELLWRSRTRRIEVPATALIHIRDAAVNPTPIQKRRMEVMNRYDAFVAACNGFSALGFHRSFFG